MSHHLQKQGNNMDRFDGLDTFSIVTNAIIIFAAIVVAALATI